MRNCCFCRSGVKVKIEDNVVGDDRLIPEGKISLFILKNLVVTCYNLS